MKRTLPILAAVALFAGITVAVATAPEADLDDAQATLAEERGRLDIAADRSRSASQRRAAHRDLLAEHQRSATAAAAQLTSAKQALEDANEQVAIAQGQLEAAHAALAAARAADHARRLSAALAAIPEGQPTAAALRRQAAIVIYQANESEDETDHIEREDDRLDHQIRALINAIALDEETAAETRKAAKRARRDAAHLAETARNIRAQAAALSR